jgi:hypothetical protein
MLAGFDWAADGFCGLADKGRAARGTDFFDPK